MAFQIVGIGASAGGLNSLQCFISALPEEFGFAVVFMQHLSPKHKSLLPELLRTKRSDLRIQEITDGLEVLPGKIYLCPAGDGVRLQKDTFHVAPPSKNHIHYSIDEFFISLAEEAGERSIAVIFSGAGTDGARGIQAIRSAGGTVFVQDPATAEFPSMPLAAINACQVDGVFEPDEIAREILGLQSPIEVKDSPGSEIAPEDFEAFFRLIYEKTGHRFNHYKKSVVGRRISRRMHLLGVSAIPDYIAMIAKNDHEAELLGADLMIGVTSFFRDRLAWKALKTGVIKKLSIEQDVSAIRVWTPACATGEEAYSIAMMLHDELDLLGSKLEIQVFATDVSESSLERAREGKYPASIAAELPQDFIRKYFTSTQDGLSVIINKEIRECVVFAKQDILTDPPFSRLDLIICRNLLIYLEPEAQEKCITLFHYALKAGGYLFLGNAESVGRERALFKSLSHKKCRIYQKLETKSSLRLPTAVPFGAERVVSGPLKQTSGTEHSQPVTEFIQEVLLEEFAPAAVAINRNYDILYHNGPTNRYLRQPRGVPTQNLLELLSENLRNRVRGAIYRAVHEDRQVSVRVVIELEDDKKRQVTLRISKIREDLFLVVFREKAGELPEMEGAVSVETEAMDVPAIHQLESELSATRQDLQSHIEQLKSLNEELQSSNEELQAANEELETSREELQSLNEELVTVNSQLQSKVEEQDETNNDLNNFIASTNIPTFFLDQRFRVKRFSPAMSKLVQLIPSDIGRPIIDMSQENLGPDLITDAKAVLDHLVPLKKEIVIDEAWYIRTALPYRTADNRVEGVVVTYNDITDLKRAEERTIHLASFPQLNPNPILEVAPSGKVIFFNPATQKALEALGIDKGDAGVFLPKDFAALFSDWDGKSESSFYREVTVKDRVFAETVQLVPQFNVARIYATDITERKRAEEAVFRAKEEWERTFDSVPDLIAIIDKEHRIKRVNRAMAAKMGLTPEQCIGLPCYQCVHDLSAPPAFCPHSKTLSDACQHFEEVHEDHLGGDFLISTTPLYDGDGQIIGSVHVAHDITERKRAEKELRQSEEGLKRSQEIAHLGSWDLDLVNNRLSWSDEVYRIFGLEPQEFDATYEAFLERVHPEDRDAVNAAYSGSLKEGRDAYEIEHRVVRKDTEIRYVHEKCQHFRDQAGKIIRSVGMVHDITGRKAAEEQIKRQVEELNTANEELLRFNRAMEGRELRMIELKKEINEHCEKAGRPPRYPLDFLED